MNKYILEFVTEDSDNSDLRYNVNCFLYRGTIEEAWEELNQALKSPLKYGGHHFCKIYIHQSAEDFQISTLEDWFDKNCSNKDVS